MCSELISIFLSFFSRSQGRIDGSTKTCSWDATVTSFCPRIASQLLLVSLQRRRRRQGQSQNQVLKCQLCSITGGCCSHPGLHSPALKGKRKERQSESCLPLLGISHLEASPSWGVGKASLLSLLFTSLQGSRLSKCFFPFQLNSFHLYFPSWNLSILQAYITLLPTYHLSPAEKFCFSTFDCSLSKPSHSSLSLLYYILSDTVHQQPVLL